MSLVDYAVHMNADKPSITCSKYEHFGQLGGNLTVSCTVMSNPASTVSVTPAAAGADDVIMDTSSLPDITTKERVSELLLLIREHYK